METFTERAKLSLLLLHGFATGANLTKDWNVREHLHPFRKSHPVAAAMAEQLVAFAAIRADEIAHVLDHAAGFFGERPQASTVPSLAGFCSSAPPRSIQSPCVFSIACRSLIARMS